jgi:hypothetical protein
VNAAVLRTLIIYAIILPLALCLGWLAVDLAEWNRTSFAAFASIIFVLLLPMLLKWHYAVLLLSWNTSITIFFLPGQPGLWMLMTGITCAIAILNRIIQKKPAFISAPSITLPLLALLVVVLVTAQLRGGMGVKVLGAASFGGKQYYFIIAGVIAYFAFASQPIPKDRAGRYVALFFLGGLVTAGSTLVYYMGPSFYFLFLVFPVGFAAVQAASDFSGGISRVAGLVGAGSALAYYLLAAHGIRGVLRSWWRPILIVLVVGLSSFGGYRSALIGLGLVFVALFISEGLLRTKIFPIMLVVGALAFGVLITVSDKLPRSVQRSLSFLPGLKVDSFVRADAQGSLEWRLEMWRAMLPELPNYFWLGKGYALNPTDIYLSEQASSRFRTPSYQTSILVGAYHSGPLSTYVPFGVFGCLTFVLFLITSIRGLYLNCRYGSEELRTINRFLLAYFCARILTFIAVFGAFANDIGQFSSIIGLSVALNNGICRKPMPEARSVKFRRDITLRTMSANPT